MTKKKTENLPARLPDILINVDQKPGVRIIDFQRQPTGDPMKIYVSDDGTVQIVQVSGYGVDTVKFDMRCLAAMMKALNVDWDRDFSGNFSLSPQRYVGDKI